LVTDGLGCKLLGLSWIATARADTILWVDDSSGNIGQVDINTHSVVARSVHNTGLGSNLTDIGFTSSGALYGTSYTGLYSLDTATGAATSLGAYGSSFTGVVGLVGNGTGLLLTSNNNNTVNSVANPASPANPPLYKTSPLPAAGDLAFSGGSLFESAINTDGEDALVNVKSGTVVSDFNLGTTRFDEVLGLADDGSTLYAVDGTDVYSVNPTTAALTLLFDYSLDENGQSLGTAFGSAFINESPPAPVPEPASFALLASAMVGLGLLRRRKSDMKP
jgi:PEP-CTERM motif